MRVFCLWRAAIPYPNEHSARLSDPGDFEKDSFRRKQIAPGVSIIMGKKSGSDSMVAQSYRFSKDKFSAAEAKQWLKDHNIKYTSFEAATNAMINNQYRREVQGNKTYLVVPGVIMQDQVMNNHFAPPDEMENSVTGWNGRPVVIRHPVANGGSVNVPNPDVPIIGRFFNAQWDAAKERITGEYWIDQEEAQKTSDGMKVLNDIYANKPMETSTGYFANKVEERGEVNGQPYNEVHRDLQPDHVALLPDDEGACSVKDGCGFNVNCAQCPCSGHAEVNTLSKARHPSYEGTEDTSWGDVTKTVEAYVKGYEKAKSAKVDSSKVADLPQACKDWIASKTLLGDPKADNDRDLMMFPVVNPSTNKLNSGALHAVVSGRGSQANIPAAALDSARNVARDLLDKEFDKGAKNMKISKKDFMNFLKGKGIHASVNAPDDMEFDMDDPEENWGSGSIQPPESENPKQKPETQFSDEEVQALKKLAPMLNAIQNALEKLPDAIQMAQNAKTQAQAQHGQLVGLITANQSNLFSKEELEAMPDSALAKLNAQFNTSYLGAGGGVQNVASDEGKGMVPQAVLSAKKEA